MTQKSCPVGTSISNERPYRKIQQPRKEQSFWNSFVLFETTNLHRFSLKFFWVVAEILGSVFAACFLFCLTIWVMNIDYSIFLAEHYAIESETRSIVWYNPEVGVSLNKKISCSKGSKLLKCDVFLRQSQPDNPDAYLFYAPFIYKFPLPRENNVLWGLLHDETPINNLIFMHEKALNLFNYSATFSRHSNVPFPLMAMRGLDALTSTRYFVNTEKKKDHLATLAPIVYMQSNWLTSTLRDDYVTRLMEYIKVDSYGYCLHNKNLPINRIYTDPLRFSSNEYRNYLFDPELLQFLARYKFVITIENGICNDYISEKLWRALEMGVVPIYFGSPLIRDWLPNNKSVILLEDYPTPELLSQHLKYLLQNDTAYEEYLKHKTLGQISNQKLIDEMNARPYQNNLRKNMEVFECFICEKLHSFNRTDINVVTKKHYDCPLPRLALSPNTDTFTYWEIVLQDHLPAVENLYEEIWNPDRTPRCSNASWR